MFKKVVALYGVPRSGTSWLGQILDSCPETVFRFQPLFSYRFKNRITTESKKEDMEQFFKELYIENEDTFLNQTDKRENGLYPVFKEKSVNPKVLSYKEVRYLWTVPILLQRYENIKIIGIVRNPYDVLESWINAPSEYKTEWTIMDEWNYAESKNEYRPENYYGYYKWKEFIMLNADMRKRYPDNFITVRYEDLSENTLDISRNLFSFLEIPFTKQTEEFIKVSQSKTIDDAYSVYRDRKKKIERNLYLPEEIKENISQDLKRFKEAKLFGYK